MFTYFYLFILLFCTKSIKNIQVLHNKTINFIYKNTLILHNTSILHKIFKNSHYVFNVIYVYKYKYVGCVTACDANNSLFRLFNVMFENNKIKTE